MHRIVVIEPDRVAAEALGLACLSREVGVVIVDNVCDAVRALLSTTVSMIVADATTLKLAPREAAMLFDRVAPTVPAVATVRSDATLEQRVALELAGFRVVTKPVATEDLLDKIGVASRR